MEMSSTPNRPPQRSYAEISGSKVRSNVSSTSSNSRNQNNSKTAPKPAKKTSVSSVTTAGRKDITFPKVVQNSLNGYITTHGSSLQYEAKYDYVSPPVKGFDETRFAAQSIVGYFDALEFDILDSLFFPKGSKDPVEFEGFIDTTEQFNNPPAPSAIIKTVIPNLIDFHINQGEKTIYLSINEKLLQKIINDHFHSISASEIDTNSLIKTKTAETISCVRNYFEAVTYGDHLTQTFQLIPMPLLSKTEVFVATISFPRLCNQQVIPFLRSILHSDHKLLKLFTPEHASLASHINPNVFTSAWVIFQANPHNVPATKNAEYPDFEFEICSRFKYSHYSHRI